MEKLKVTETKNIIIENELYLQRTEKGFEDEGGNVVTTQEHPHIKKALSITVPGDVLLFKKTAKGFDVFKLSADEAAKVGFGTKTTD